MREIEIKVHSFKFKKLFALTACACMALGVVSIPVQAQDIKDTGASVTYTSDATQSLSKNEREVIDAMQKGDVYYNATSFLRSALQSDKVQYGTDVTDKMLEKVKAAVEFKNANKDTIGKNQFNGYEIEKNHEYAKYISAIYEVIDLEFIYDDKANSISVLDKAGGTMYTSNVWDERKSPLETATEDAKDPSKIIEAIKNTDRPSVIIAFEKESELQAKAVFEAAKDAGKKLSFVIGTDYKSRITFSFNEGIKNPVDMNFGLEQVVNAGIVKGLEGAVAFNFKHNGALPGPMTVRMYSEAYKDVEEETELYLYLLDEATGKLVKQEQPATVRNGWVEFTITHCSSYVTTLTELSAEQVQVADPVTPETDKEEVVKATGNEISVSLGFKTLALITLCGAAVFITTRKEKA